MTECNGCGGCCNPVILPYPLTYVRQHPDEFPDDNRRWMLEDLEPIPLDEAAELEPGFIKRALALFQSGKGPMIHTFKCRNFNWMTRICMVYERRPRVCRDYPWLRGVPILGTPLPSACSFRADIGEPVEFLPTKRGL